jgi:nicotinate phosphoribosyltransferase
VSEDCPALDCVYKLQEYAGRPRRKRSSGKATWPGAKQVYRKRHDDGTFERDVLTLATDTLHAEPLLVPLLRHGESVAATVSLVAIREHAAQQLAALPAALRTLDRHEAYDVDVSAGLTALAARVDAEFR